MTDVFDGGDGFYGVDHARVGVVILGVLPPKVPVEIEHPQDVVPSVAGEGASAILNVEGRVAAIGKERL